MVRYTALKSLYEVERTIGTGGFAKVKLATHILTGEKVAIKIMEKACLGDDYPRVKIELEALKSISHHHICKLYQVIETSTHFFIVMEYCSGGELFDHIVEKNRLSESESRSFFRQIVSAVAYLHSKGYAHRDLKPENILLDKDQNLKLIDFGLCAKPVGGMSSQLQTSCGSPTYAAPELIKGNKYMGSEVDIWSMGVLLYALLCGFLPFDCETIENLYKKILNGKYDEPQWLSCGSKQIIRQMLQVDPRKRIKIEDLLSHPWMTMGYYEPVTYHTIHEYRERNNNVIDVMANHVGVSSSLMWSKVSEWSYNYDTATYQLLLARKKRNQPLKLNNIQYRIRHRPKNVAIPLFPEEFKPSPNRKSYVMLKATMNESMDNLCGKENCDVKTTPVRTPRKRAHGPDDAPSPIPLKITPGKSRDTPSTSTQSPLTPNNVRKGFLCSVEKKFHQVRNVLTPRKRLATPTKNSSPLKPATFNTKDLCNVSTTNSTNPDYVLEELRKALSGKGIFCKCKGFTLRGKIEESKTDNRCCKLFFELEVCLIQSTVSNSTDKPIVGIRRKRLKGDAWCYKKICEEILQLTQTDLSA